MSCFPTEPHFKTNDKCQIAVVFCSLNIPTSIFVALCTRKTPKRYINHIQLNIQIAFISWKYTFLLPMAVLPPIKQSCQLQSEIVLVLISEKQSLQSLWNHQVGHSAAVSYLPWYWWAILALRGFSLLKAVTIYSVSLSWVPKRFDMPLRGFFFNHASVIPSTPVPLQYLCCGII